MDQPWSQPKIIGIREFLFWIRLMYILSYPFLEIFFWELKKLSILFQFRRKFFPKMKIIMCP